MASKQVTHREKNLSHPYENFSANIVDIKGLIVFLILMFWPVFRIKSSALFLDEAIYMEFQA